VEYHRTLRDNNLTKSVLNKIDGVGAVRRKALLKHFKSVDNIKRATLDEIKAVDGINEKVATAVYEFFRA